MNRRTLFAGTCGVAGLIGLTSAALAECPDVSGMSVPGFRVQTYACWSDMNDMDANPEQLAFAPSGELYVSQDVPGTNEPPLPILRIGPGGFPIEEYGDSLIYDPDPLCFDATGRITGTPGSLLTGGVGHITVIYPNEETTVLCTDGITNPNRMVIDHWGRLLIADPTAGQVLISEGGCPEVFFAQAYVYAIAVDSTNRIFTRSGGEIRIYTSGGVELPGSPLVSGLSGPGSSALAVAPGGIWGTDLYAFSDGELLRWNLQGESPVGPDVIGTGFDAISDMTFGPDGALYLSFAGQNDVSDAILRVSHCPADFDNDGDIDASDLANLLGSWGECS